MSAPQGTNSAGTAQSSGARGASSGGAGGLGSGTAIDAAPRTGNDKVDAEDKAVDRKVKSICKGC
jgi:hypothetical protein